MTEPNNKPLNQMSAQERLDLGLSYLGEGRFDEAIKAWSNIHHDDDPGIYARTQLGLGILYEKSGMLDQAIGAWSNIHHDDDPEAYAKAQFNLGNAYESLGMLDQAIGAWSNIHHDDDPEAYAKAQFNLGVTYRTQGEQAQAIKAWSNIHHDDDPETYAKAQLNLGVAYAESGERKQAIKMLSNIHHDDDPETYAKAQLNLGLAYKAQGNLDEAITAWKKVREDNPETYAQAQLNLGAAYAESGELEQVIEAWSNIHREEVDPETYAWAQLGLGAAYAKSGELKQAIKTWSNIRRSDDSEIYAQAQLNLGAAYAESGKREQAIKTWSNIHREKADPETYAGAQLNLGEVYSLDKEKEEQSYEAYNNAQEFSYYKPECGFKILKCPQKIRKDLHTLAESTDEVLKYLQIIPAFESKVAHYTRPQIAFNLFGDEKNNKNPSNFRLSTIRGVNDPTEGLVLRDYWDQQGISETIHTNDTATFISCFTFNHDNLNQFRLYGKENGREATGVSLVFKKEFFSDQPDTLGFIAGPSTDLSSKSEQIKLNETGKTEGDNKKQIIGKSTLYRCIYLDPETGYWTLAQRDKSTFYREHNEEADAKGKWGKYYKSISTKEDDVETHLFNKENNDDNSVSSILKSIFTEDHLYNKCNKDEKQKILETIRFILLPLQYLVKHIAFQEEQECRIMYITHLHDEKIRHDWEKQWMYVEYEEPVLPHIDKIWLSPGAAKDQDFFRILLDQGSGKSKVRISQNPFRNKE